MDPLQQTPLTMPTTDPALYYSDQYIDEMMAKGITDLAIVVTSWSGSAMQYPRSINIGARQSRDLPHHLAYAQKLKEKGITLKIFYLAFDNTMHFNHKDKRAVDNKILPAYMDYILSFSDNQIAKDQFQAIYLNPRYKEKEGDLVDELLVFENNEGLTLSGENTVALQQLKQQIAAYHQDDNRHVIGMTAHSNSDDIEQLARFLNINLIGTSKVCGHYGTKEGNKALFEMAKVPYAFGSTTAKKTIAEVLDDCCYVAQQTKCKRIIIKHNSSSAGKGNLDVDISDCYDAMGSPYTTQIKQKAQHAIENHMHELKDKNLISGQENFYMRKIRELGAIVEARLEGKDIVSPGSLAVISEDGTVNVEYIYDQILLGDKGHFFGGSIGPTDISEALQQQIISLTKQVGQTLAEQGGKGYFGLDFVIIDNSKVMVIEANLRKTGTKYPFLLANQLLSPSQLSTKTLFHDDNIKLPLTALDISGDNSQLNRFISEFFSWIKSQSVSFNHQSNTGAVISFDTHTAGKLGVLAIGDSKQHAQKIITDFKAALNEFSFEVYPKQLNQQNNTGIDLAKLTLDVNPQETPLSPLMQAKGLVNSPRKTLPSISKWDRFRHKVSKLFSSASCCSSVEVKTSPPVKEQPKEASHAPTFFNFMPAALRMANRNQSSELSFALLGKTTTSDQLLVMAAKKGIEAYRITESSRIVYDENSGQGYITNVHCAVLDSKTNQYKITYSTNEHPLPTIVYDYDFSKSKTITYQARGDRIINDKLFNLKKLLDKLGVVYFNPAPLQEEEQSQLTVLSPLRSQLALFHALKQYGGTLADCYPRTFNINTTNADALFEFIDEFSSFYVKPVFSLRQHDSNTGNIYISKLTEQTEGGEQNYLQFKYLIANPEKPFDTLAKQLKVNLNQLAKPQLEKLIDKIKSEMGFHQSAPFLIQQALDTPLLVDQSQRPMAQKLRVVSQYVNDEIVISSIYGVYGGPNAFLSYTGDPAIYIDAYLKTDYGQQLTAEQVMADIHQVAKLTHSAIQQSQQTRCGELITDIILTEQGIIPLKVSTKPERPDIERIAKQTHYGQHLEKDINQRQQFIEQLSQAETIRNKLILCQAQRLHSSEYMPAQQLRKNDVRVIELVETESLARPDLAF